MLQKVSYDERQHAQYQRGRAFPRERLTRWIETFAAYAPNARSLAVLDLGSGTGRLTPALAKAFGGPVYGRRAVAEDARDRGEFGGPFCRRLSRRQRRMHSAANASVDLVLMYLSLHHVGLAFIAAHFLPSNALENLSFPVV